MPDSGKGTRLVLTGGIGSGKSTAAWILADLGATVIDADRIGHEVLDGPAFDRVAQRWPSVVTDGRIDRTRLAAIVFSDESELRELEAISHPLIREQISRKVKDAPADRPVVVEISVPVLMIDGEWMTVVVDVPEAVRRARLLERGMARGDIDARMARQPSRDEWRRLADVVIDNSGSVTELRNQIVRLLSRDP